MIHSRDVHRGTEPEVLERVAGMVEDTTRAVLKNPILLGGLMIALVILKVRFGSEEGI